MANENSATLGLASSLCPPRQTNATGKAECPNVPFPSRSLQTNLESGTNCCSSPSIAWRGRSTRRRIDWCAVAVYLTFAFFAATRCTFAYLIDLQIYPVNQEHFRCHSSPYERPTPKENLTVLGRRDRAITSLGGGLPVCEFRLLRGRSECRFVTASQNLNLFPRH